MEELVVNICWFCPNCNNHWVLNSNQSGSDLCWKCNTKQTVKTYAYVKKYDNDQYYTIFNDIQIIRRL